MSPPTEISHDFGFAIAAKLSGSITVSELISYTERAILKSANSLPDYIYEVACLDKTKATVSDLKQFMSKGTNPTSAEDKVLMAISVVRDPEILGRTDEPRPKNLKAARNVLELYPNATMHFKDLFPEINL